MGPEHTFTALYVVRLKDVPREHVATARVRWLDPDIKTPSESDAEITVADLDPAFSAAPPRMQIDYAAGFFAEVLRKSPFGRDTNLDDLAAIVDAAAKETEDGQVAELGMLIRLTRRS